MWLHNQMQKRGTFHSGFSDGRWMGEKSLGLIPKQRLIRLFQTIFNKKWHQNLKTNGFSPIVVGHHKSWVCPDPCLTLYLHTSGFQWQWSSLNSTFVFSLFLQTMHFPNCADYYCHSHEGCSSVCCGWNFMVNVSKQVCDSVEVSGIVQCYVDILWHAAYSFKPQSFLIVQIILHHGERKCSWSFVSMYCTGLEIRRFELHENHCP